MRLNGRHNGRGAGAMRFLPFVALLLLAACNRVPSEVIQPDEMADVLTDIYIADAIVLNDYQTYGSDSAKLALRQSVLDKYHITSADLDTSMGWYGRNLKLYSDVQDEVIKRLRERLTEVSDVASAEAASIMGDSVNIWTSAPFIRLRQGEPEGFLSFSFKSDTNWVAGDSYTWRTKFLNRPEKGVWRVGVLYDDGEIEYQNADIMDEGWQNIVLVTDSTKQPRRIFGSLQLAGRKEAPVWLDSIQLVRKRLNVADYANHYRMRKAYVRKTVEPDSIATTGSVN